MVMDKRFAELREHFGIIHPEDWCEVHPADILALHNVGPMTLNQLRLELANRGLTLRNDETPAYWQTHMDAMRNSSQVSATESCVVPDFTILVDKAEQQPFTFQGIRSDAQQGHKPMLVMTRRTHLGPTHGDYTIEGLEGALAVERKSMSDCQSTVLGWGERREQFQRTLEYLASIESSLVVVEAEFDECILQMQARGKKSKAENQKIFYRQVLAWQDDYRVPWLFTRSRRTAEVCTFDWLRRKWRHVQAERKRAERRAKETDLFDLTGF